MKHKFTVFGSCVTRDIFNFLDDTEYIPNLTIERASISTLFSESLNISRDDIEKFQGKTRFEKRLIGDGLNKEAITKICANDSEYFVFDLGEERFPLQTWTWNNRVSLQPVYWELYNFSMWLKSIEGYKDIEIANWHLADKNLEEYREYINKFCDVILNKYSPEKIIYISVRQVDKAISKEQNRMLSFTTNRNELTPGIDPIGRRIRQNRIIEYAEKIILDRMAGCWIVKMPSNAFASCRHHFAVHPLHFDGLFYEYCCAPLSLTFNGFDCLSRN